MSDEPERMEPAAVASWLRQIADNVRSAGDVPLVLLDENGVGPAVISLADELWLAAFQLDGQIPTPTDPDRIAP